MVKLRLTRVGRHKRAYFRIIAVDSRSKVNGGYIELLGNYDPIANSINLFEDKILNWLHKGAQPSDTVRNVLKDNGIWAKFVATKATTPKKSATNKKKSSKSTAKPAAKPAVKKAAVKPVAKVTAEKPAEKPVAKVTAEKPAVKKTVKKTTK